MYQEFYGLKEKPFSLTPDPQFLYLSEGHRTATDSLLYGIEQKMGFMVLTGDIGTGKTTICRALLGKLGKNVRTALIFSSFANGEELLTLILQDLGLPAEEMSRKDQIQTLNRFLLDRLSQRENVVLLIDEAQNLSIPILEEIRMLSNLETEKEKILQIILVGQMELDQKLRAPELKQLNQRVAVRHRLQPLSRSEMEGYIHHRLTVAGAQGGIVFSRSGLNEIYRFSKGTPRLINLLCDRALLAGFVDQTSHISLKTVRKAKQSLLGEEMKAPLPSFFALLRRSVPLHISLLMIFFALIAGLAFSGPAAKKFLWQKIQGTYTSVEPKERGRS